MDYQTLKSEPVFEGKVFKVRIDEVATSSGSRMRVDVVEHRGAVAILPIDQEGRLWFVRQYRHPAEGWLLEIPAGTLSSGEEPEDCARRECREEVGMAPGRLELLGAGFMAPGYSTEYIHIYLASELTPSPLPQDEDEDLRVVKLTWQQALEAMGSGEIQDIKTLAALGLAHVRGLADA